MYKLSVSLTYFCNILFLAVFHTYSVFLMLFVTIFGRFAFRRKADALAVCVEVDPEQGSDDGPTLEDNNGNDVSESTTVPCLDTSRAAINI